MHKSFVSIVALLISRKKKKKEKRKKNRGLTGKLKNQILHISKITGRNKKKKAIKYIMSALIKSNARTLNSWGKGFVDGIEL